MKRRNFLKNTILASIPLNLGGLKLLGAGSLLQTGLNQDNDKILIIIQLDGGNDGLNTVIPLDQYNRLSEARGNILIPEQEVLQLNHSLGLHPLMNDMLHLFEEEKLNIIQSVGYPNQNRSHFRSRDIWSSGSPSEEYWNTGWLGRYFEGSAPDFPEGYPNEDFKAPFSISMGSSVSETCEGNRSNFSVALQDPSFLFDNPSSCLEDYEPGLFLDELSHVRTIQKQTDGYSTSVNQAYRSGDNIAEYPDNNPLADQLKTVARLISGGLQSKVYVANLTGFDTHVGQANIGDPTSGKHAHLLQQLSSAIGALQNDLEALGLDERVIGLTYSEFGRQIKSNANLGTDHGTAGPVFLFGSCVSSRIIGLNPIIPNMVSEQEGIPMQFDFRSIYRSLLVQWLGVDESALSEIGLDEYQQFQLAGGCFNEPETPTNTFEAEKMECNVFPSPFKEQLQVSFFSEGGSYQFEIYDLQGKQVKLVKRQFAYGPQSFQVKTEDLISGNYFYRIFNLKSSASGALIRI